MPARHPGRAVGTGGEALVLMETDEAELRPRHPLISHVQVPSDGRRCSLKVLDDAEGRQEVLARLRGLGSPHASVL